MSIIWNRSHIHSHPCIRPGGKRHGIKAIGLRQVLYASTETDRLMVPFAGGGGFVERGEEHVPLRLVYHHHDHTVLFLYILIKWALFLSINNQLFWIAFFETSSNQSFFVCCAPSLTVKIHATSDGDSKSGFHGLGGRGCKNWPSIEAEVGCFLVHSLRPEVSVGKNMFHMFLCPQMVYARHL